MATDAGHSLTPQTTPGFTTASTDISSEDEIAVLGSQIERLKRYPEQVLSLSLVESHAKLQEELVALKQKLAQKKLVKAEEIISQLAEDFPDIAITARKELERRQDIQDA